MKASNNSPENNLKIAEAYYSSMMRHDFDTVEQYLHTDVHLISPLATELGREAVVEAAKKFSMFCNDIKIREKFSAGHQIMLAYDLTFVEPIGVLNAAVLMEFQDNCISRIELFYDGSPFKKIKHDIFS